MISEKPKAQSHFVTYISVKDNSPINNELIFPKVEKFFAEKGITDYKPISENFEISDVDFKKVEFSYFYDVIFYDIAKNKEGKIEIPVKYCITIDKQNCSKVHEENWMFGEVLVDRTEILYDEILLYNQPIFYFIYVDIEEIFSFLRTNSQ